MHLHSARGLVLRIAACVIAAVVGTSVEAQTAATDNGEAKQFVTDYAKAWNAGDVAALGKMWMPDGELIDAQGVAVDRKALLAKRMAAAGQGKRPVLSISVDKVRFLDPNVALVDGESKMATPDGSASQQTRFSGVLVKQDGAWKIRMMRQLSTRQSPQAPPAEPVKEMGWLVGEWSGMGEGMEVHVSTNWDMDKRFIVSRFEYKPKGGEPYEAEVRAGWDPELHTIKSWYFDSRGTISNTVWQKMGDHWIGSVTGTRNDGESFTSTMAITQIDNDSYLRTMTNVKMGGEAMPDQELRMFRVPAEPAQ